MSKEQSAELWTPEQLTVDPVKATRSLFVPGDGGLYGDGNIKSIFENIDSDYENNRLGYFRDMASGVFRTKSGVEAGFARTDSNVQGRDLMVVMSPLNDGVPMSSPENIEKYARNDSEQKISRGKAAPNSWGPATKLWIDHDFGVNTPHAMPRLQIFARDIPHFNRDDKYRVAHGDMMPFWSLAEEGIDHINNHVREVYGAKGFNRIHFFAAGMGSKALGAAVGMTQNSDKYELGAVTLMNLTINEDNVIKMLSDYVTRRKVGEPYKVEMPDNFVRVIEPLIRREVDGRGPELAMHKRNIAAMMNALSVKAIMNAKRAPEYIDYLMNHGSTVTVVNSTNEAMTQETSKSLPGNDSQFNFVSIVGVGKEVGMMANEHAAVVAVANNLGLANHFRRIGE